MRLRSAKAVRDRSFIVSFLSLVGSDLSSLLVTDIDGRTQEANGSRKTTGARPQFFWIFLARSSLTPRFSFSGVEAAAKVAIRENLLVRSRKTAQKGLKAHSRNGTVGT